MMFVVVLSAALLLSVLIWLVQESAGRAVRVANIVEHAGVIPAKSIMPGWLKGLTAVLVVIWSVVAAVLLVTSNHSGLSDIGDFSLILLLLTLASGFVAGVDRFVFMGRRVRLMGAAAVQRVLSQLKNLEQRQQVVDWAERDFVVAEYAKSFFPVLLVVLVLRSFLFEPFKIPSASMVPTLQIHDFILVNKFAYGVRLPVIGTKVLPVGEPARGDVMVFYPPNDKRYFIKRVVGLPGDHIQLKDNVLYINGVQMEQRLLRMDESSFPPQVVMQENLQPKEHILQYLSAQHYPMGTPQSNYEAVVPANAYFMMGDNRDNSSDSRFWGVVPEANIVGKAVYIWMHWEGLSGLPSFSRSGVIQ